MRFPQLAASPFSPTVEAFPEIDGAAALEPGRTGRGQLARLPRGKLPYAVESHEFADRTIEDRRKLCRRLYQEPVMLDTRTGKERRKDGRRQEDTPTHFAKKV
jgi:hypothetical protein